MHRDRLLQLLADYAPLDAADRASRDRIAAFVRANPPCFERSLLEGHVTGSAWILDEARSACLLTHHRKLDRWLQLGGHADGDGDVLAVAMREAVEESGLRSLRPLSSAVFDCDVHLIPARGAEPAHWHYDVRFLLQADADEPLVVSAESKDLAWVALGAVSSRSADDSVLRMVAKTPAAPRR